MTDKELRCPKCGAYSGDDWSQCEGSCPMPMIDELAPSAFTHIVQRVEWHTIAFAVDQYGRREPGDLYCGIWPDEASAKKDLERISIKHAVHFYPIYRFAGPDHAMTYTGCAVEKKLREIGEVVAAERIVSVAARIKCVQPQDNRPSELVLSVPRPARHHNIFWSGNAALLGGGESGRIVPPDAEQGFLTSSGRFVDRKEGWMIAEAAKQITPHPSLKPGTLFSEDLW